MCKIILRDVFVSFGMIFHTKKRKNRVFRKRRINIERMEKGSVMKDYLYDIAAKMNIEISERQLEQFQLYYDHLIEINQVMNLTAITEEKEVVLKHFVDSISIMNYCTFSDNMKVIDVGTGAGFPGIPLAILFPQVQFTLMDSLNKRIRFLNEVISICGLNNVTCYHGRAEEMGVNPQFREKYDLCVSRAVANLSVLLEYCIPFVKVGGMFLSYKSSHAEEELKESGKAQEKLSCHLKEHIIFELPDTDISRCFLMFEKDHPLSKKYPRQNGMPKKNPL